jgi:hypothetical protein
VLFLSFFLFQGCVRLAAGTERINGKVFAEVKRQVEQFQPISANPVTDQIETVIGLAPSNLSIDRHD